MVKYSRSRENQPGAPDHTAVPRRQALWSTMGYSLVLFLVSLTLCTAALAQCGPGELFPDDNPHTEVGGLPQAVAIGDLDGDGKNDLVVGLLIGQVNVLLGNGDGSFDPPSSYATTDLVVLDVQIVDLNDDGVLDVVAVVVLGNAINVLLGNGDGTLAAAVEYDVGLLPKFSTIQDFDGDGVPDVATSNFNSGDVSILLGLGDGTFAPAFSYPSGFWPQGIASGDFDQDGAVDLAVANHGGWTVAVFPGNGDGTFSPPVLYDVASPGSLSAADMDGDGLLDLVVGVGASICVMQGLADGTFELPECVPVDAAGGPFNAEVGDLNGDGWLDVATSKYGNDEMTVYLGGTGGLEEAGSYETGNFPWGIALGNLLGGNGAMDIVVANSEAVDATVFLNLCAEGFVRGDCNSDNTVDISDAIHGLSALFVPGAQAPLCDDACDANDDGEFDLGDPVMVLITLFVGGSLPLPAPHPGCGTDPTPDGLDCTTPGCSFP